MSNRATAKIVDAKLKELNFNWIEEAVILYKDSSTRPGEKVRIIDLFARKIAPDLKAVEITGEMDVNTSNFDVTGLSIEQLGALVEVAAQVGGEDDEDNSELSEESDEE